ncbi:MAG: integrin alpha, partial [Candidatus Thermoplasmatota archaeon]|nr:integrin alpha [Candidatus Thermoplasmatota archaeon]
GTYTTGTWQHVRIIADSDTDKVDIYIDDMDTPAVSQGNFYEPTGDIGFIQIATTAAGTGTFYVDDVFIYTPYETPGTFISTPLTSTEDISTATVSWNATLNSQNLTVSVSRDGGTTWTTVSNGVEYSFTGSEPTGKALKYRLQMNTSNTLVSPVVHYVTLSHTTSVSLNYINFTGAASGSRFGHSVASAGDFSGDGNTDIIIGAPYNGTGGAVYVFNGTGGDWAYASSVSASSANYTRQSSVSNELFGWSVDAAYNVKSSAYNATLVGAPGNSTPAADSGAAYVLAVVVPPPEGDVELSKTANVTSIGNGGKIGYTVSFTVNSAVSGLKIKDTLPEGVTVNSIFVSGGFVLNTDYTQQNSGRTYYWNFSTTVQPGSYYILINVTYTGPNDGRSLLNTATANWTDNDHELVAMVVVPVIPFFSELAIPLIALLILYHVASGGKIFPWLKRKRRKTAASRRASSNSES